MIIGFDSEYVSQGASNHVLSYQFFGKTNAGTWSGTFYTKGPEKKLRLRLKDLMGGAVEAGRKAGVLPRQWPSIIYAVAHFSRADLSSLRDYSSLRTRFDSIRGTYVTSTLPYRCRYIDRNNHRHDLTIHLRDTATMSPAGSKLAALGELHGLPKLDIGLDMLGQMDVQLREDPELFEAYAIRDAEIAALHAWAMTEFSITNGLGAAPPLTLGSLAVDHLQALWDRDNLHANDILGNETVEQRPYNQRSNQYRTRRLTVPLAAVHDQLSLATECYHGGRNEAFMFGFTDMASWYDYDLAGAYSTAMAALRMPDWINVRVSHTVADYQPDVLGLARVRFRFPDDTRFPCLPVRSDNGLIFPLEGVSNCGAPEIALALNMGAEITIEYGFVVPWLNDVRPIEMLTRSVAENRAKHAKGTVYNATWKEIGNSVYGKLAQGLREKRVYDSRTDRSQILPTSRITQPYLAAYTTSLVRAVLGELLNGCPTTCTVVSVTTDGFLCNAEIDQIDTSGPLTQLYIDLSKRMRGDDPFLERKHFVPVQLCCMKTRGQLTVGFSGLDKPVVAKAGQKPPEEVLISATEAWADMPPDQVPDDLKDRAENDWLLRLFLTRDSTTSIPVWSFISMRDMAKADSDITKIVTDRRANLEYDFKRELYDPCEVLVGRSFGDGNSLHLSLSSSPHRTLEDFQFVRQTFDEWRIKRDGVLKTLDDWTRWQEFRNTTTLRKQGILTGRGRALDQAKRMFLKAYTNKLWGLSGGNYQELADWLTEKGYDTSVTDIKNAKRSKLDVSKFSELETEDVAAFKAVLLERWPLFG